MFVQAPVIDGRAVIHLKTIAFPRRTEDATNSTFFNGVGRSDMYAFNMHGVNQWMDFARTFDMVVKKSENVTTHMQQDIITVDLGFITNGGMQLC